MGSCFADLAASALVGRRHLDISVQLGEALLTRASSADVVNGVVGHITHSPLLVPFYPWAYSHKQHHRFHNHETKDMSHPWMSSEQYGDVNPIVRALALVSVF